MVAGRELTPNDAANTERLNEYWAHGEGAAKIAWGTPGDYDRCLVELGKYVTPGQLHGHCANLHHEALGIWPATHAKLDREGRTPASGMDAAIRNAATTS